MELMLSDEDARTLRDYLRDHLRELKLELAHTDAREFRRGLVQRLESIERVLAQLEREVSV